MAEVIEDRFWLARIEGPNGEIVGAGFVVDAGHVLTCAHVVAAAGAGPGDAIHVHFPRLGRGDDAEVLADGWSPAAGTAGDVALLALSAPPAGLRPAPLRALGSLDNLAFSAYGFPWGYDEGLWTRGSLGLAVGDEWVQLEGASARNVEAGFSGTAVWSDDYKAVIGMMVARDPETSGGVAFAIPIRVLADRHPVIDRALPSALELDPAREGHWDASARGGRTLEGGWLFTGRRRALSELVEWLVDDGPPTARAVTGSPGCGKSAVLARLVTTSDGRYRERLPDLAQDDPTVPPVDAIDVTFHARNETVAGFIAHVEDVLQVDAGDSQGLLVAIERRKQRLVVVVDALDEATEPRELASLLDELSRHGCRVLVGSRPHLVTRVLSDEPIDLDKPPYLELGDIESYVERRLAGSRADHAKLELAAEIASSARGNFLVAQLVAQDIVLTGIVTRPFPKSVAQAFHLRLDGLTEHDPTARELLLPLAYGLGDGLPDDLWLAGAVALSRSFEPGDIRRLLNGPAGSFTLTSLRDGGGRRHRLFHQALADALASESDPDRDRRGLWSTWTDQILKAAGRPRWAGAASYLLEHGAEHAAAVNKLAELANDADYLLSGDLIRLSIQLRVDGPDETVSAEALLRVAGRLAQPLGRDERAFLLALAGRHLGLHKLAEQLLSEGKSKWYPQWAHSLGTPHQKLIGHEGSVNSVALGTASGRAVIVTGGADGVVRRWDAVAGEPLGEPLIGHDGRVTSVAMAHEDARDIIVSGGSDGTVRLWDAATGKALCEPLTDHEGAVTGVAVARADGRAIVASSSNDRTIRRWDALTGNALGAPIVCPNVVLTVAAGRVRGRDVVASGTFPGRIDLWDAATGERFGVAPRGEHVSHDEIAIGDVGGRGLVASPIQGGFILLWDGPLNTRKIKNDGREVSAVAIGRVGGRDVIASASARQTVQLIDAITGDRIDGPLVGHDGSVKAVVVGNTADRDIVASAGEDGTVRIWDPAPQVGSESLFGHTGPVRGMAVGQVGDREVVVSSGSDRTVQIWDAATGEALGDPLATDNIVGGWVAIGQSAEEDTIAFADLFRTRLWVASKGEPVGRLHSLDSKPGRAGVIVRTGDIDVLVSCGFEGLERRNLMTGETLGPPLLKPPGGGVDAVAVGQVGGRNVIASGAHDVRLWDAETGTPLFEPLAGHSGPVQSVAIGDAGGREIVAAADEGAIVRLWDAITGDQICDPLSGHSGAIMGLVIGQSGGRDIIASASTDATVRVWNARSGQPLSIIHTVEPATALGLAPSGAMFVATGRALCCVVPAIQVGRLGCAHPK